MLLYKIILSAFKLCLFVEQPLYNQFMSGCISSFSFEACMINVISDKFLLTLTVNRNSKTSYVLTTFEITIMNIHVYFCQCWYGCCLIKSPFRYRSKLLFTECQHAIKAVTGNATKSFIILY